MNPTAPLDGHCDSIATVGASKKLMALCTTALGTADADEPRGVHRSGGRAKGRYAVQSRGEPQKKYWRFLRQNGDWIAGLVPYGSVSLLYAYWAGNPGNLGHSVTSTVAEYLSSQHVLYRGLVDRDLEATDLIPAQEDRKVTCEESGSQHLWSLRQDLGGWRCMH